MLLRSQIPETRKDRIRNKIISDSLRVEALQNTTEQTRLKSYRHMRMNRTIPRTTIEMKVRGSLARNHTRWIDQATKYVEQRGRNWNRVLEE